MIDPQLQGYKWIKTRYGSRLKVDNASVWKVWYKKWVVKPSFISPIQQVLSACWNLILNNLAKNLKLKSTLDKLICVTQRRGVKSHQTIFWLPSWTTKWRLYCLTVISVHNVASKYLMYYLFQIVRLGSHGYIDAIEKAVETGEILLMENIGESVDAVLDHLLGRNTIKKGRAIKVNVF